MDNFPIISIIVPAYNVEKYISKTLDSIITQKSANYEVLIINDGSTDGTSRVIRKYIIDKKFKQIETKNRGVSSARNTGFLKSTGKFVLFLDGDDWLEPNFLAIMISKMEEDNSDVCYCDCDVEKDGKILRRIKHKYSRNSMLLSYLRSHSPIIPSLIVFRREFLLKNNILFTPGCTYGEDFEFIIKTFILGKVSSIPKSLVHWVQRETSATATSIRIRDIYDVTERSIKFIQFNISDPFLSKRYITELKFRYIPTQFARMIFKGRLRKFPKATQVLKSPFFRNTVKSFKVKIDKRTLQFFIYILGVYFPKSANFVLNMYYSIQKGTYAICKAIK